jgi:hypothetical protein
MTKLVWDAPGERKFETGVDRGVLYPSDGAGGYAVGVPWNGLTGVTEAPSGAEPTPLYASNKKYLSLTSLEELGVTIEAYTYPPEFAECDGSKELLAASGVSVGQQGRKLFGLSYRSMQGDDIDTQATGYKIHLLYGATAKPSERAYKTINDSPEANTFSWEASTTPVEIAAEGFKPSASLIIDSTAFVTEPQLAKLAEIEELLYGDATAGVATLPTPDEILAILNAAG